jgi:hypothetical protein
MKTEIDAKTVKKLRDETASKTHKDTADNFLSLR